jgi:hypothetical protein
VGILAIHSLFQPFKNRKHNYLESLYLVCLSLMSVGNSYLQSVSTASTSPWYNHYIVIAILIGVISFCLVLLPASLTLGICWYKILSKRVCCQRCVSTLKNCCSREDGEREPLIPEQHVLEEERPLHVVEWSA